MKIEIIVNKADFEYDIFGLVQAFYPREEIEIVYDVADEDARSLPYQTRNHRRHREEKGRDKTGKQIASTKATEEPDEQTASTKATEEPDEQTACDKPDRILRVEYLPGQIHIAFAPEGDFRYDHIEKLPSDWPEDPAHDKTVRPEMKNILKMAVYDILSEETGKTLPWGTLTGIRPTKIPLRMVQDGASDQEISTFMKEHYKSSDEKIAIATEIARLYHKIYHEDLGAERAQFIDKQVQESFEGQIRTSRIVFLFALIAILISMLGLIAMSTYFIEQRQKEIAVRKVFGSTSAQMRRRL